MYNLMTHTSNFIIKLVIFVYRYFRTLIATMLTMMLLFYAVNYLITVNNSTDKYLEYTTIDIEDTTVGERAIAKICRIAREEYSVTGGVEFYIVGNNHKLVYDSYEDFDKNIPQRSGCETEKIPTQKLAAGKYRVVLYRTFNVLTKSGVHVEKHTPGFWSNTFNVKE